LIGWSFSDLLPINTRREGRVVYFVGLSLPTYPWSIKSSDLGENHGSNKGGFHLLAGADGVVFSSYRGRVRKEVQGLIQHNIEAVKGKALIGCFACPSCYQPGMRSINRFKSLLLLNFSSRD